MDPLMRLFIQRCCVFFGASLLASAAVAQPFSRKSQYRAATRFRSCEPCAARSRQHLLSASRAGAVVSGGRARATAPCSSWLCPCATESWRNSTSAFTRLPGRERKAIASDWRRPSPGRPPARWRYLSPFCLLATKLDAARRESQYESIYRFWR